MLVTLLGIVTLVRLAAAIEGIIPDAGDAVGNRHTRQAGTAKERIIPDAGDAVGNRHIRQAGATAKASSPMLVTLLGIVTLVRLVQPSKA